MPAGAQRLRRAIPQRTEFIDFAAQHPRQLQALGLFQ